MFEFNFHYNLNFDCLIVQTSFFQMSNDPDAIKKGVTKENAVRIAKKLQRLYEVNKTKDELENEKLPAGKRKSVFMTSQPDKQKQRIFDLVTSYKTKMKMYDDEGKFSDLGCFDYFWWDCKGLLNIF